MASCAMARRSSIAAPTQISVLLFWFAGSSRAEASWPGQLRSQAKLPRGDDVGSPFPEEGGTAAVPSGFLPGVHAVSPRFAYGSHQADVDPLKVRPRHHQDAADVTHSLSQRALGSSVVVPPFAAYPLSAGFVAAIVVFLYWPRGSRVVLSVLAYLAALSTMKLSVKWVFMQYGFHYAIFLSAMHFLTGGLVSFALMIAQRNGEQIPVPTKMEFFGMILPIALAVVLSIGANNMALVFSSAAFTEIIGSTNCLVTIAMVIVMGMPFDRRLVIPALFVASGCALSTAGEINFSGLGTFLCLMANVFRSAKVALQQKLMTGETRDRFDPCSLLLWISMPSVVIMLTGSLISEGLRPMRHLLSLEAHQLHGLLTAIFVSCVNATALNLAQLFVTKDLGAVGSQLIAQAKTVLTVLGAMALFGEAVTYLEVIGFVQVLVGVYAFSRMEQVAKAEQAKS